MYIDDFIPTLANACNKFEALSECIAVNIGGEEYRSVEELSDIILKNVPGCNSEIEILPEDVHNIVNKRPDIKLAKTLLNHAPKVVLEEGIIKTLEWMRKVNSI
jgi:dTDP-glucose 4,6-dehydratase